MNRLRKLLSIANLRHRTGRRKGQITTLMLLMIVVVLSFVMMTANLGQLSMTATRLSNAADASALLLGSQLATKSKVLWESMEHQTEKCKKANFFSSFLAIPFAIAMLVLAPYLAPALVGTMVTTVAGVTVATGAAGVIAGAIGGAVGGAIGGAITGGGQGALSGALQGALVGASLGLGVSAGAAAGAKIGASMAVSAMGASAAILEGAGASLIAAGTTAGGIGGAALSAGSSVYTAVVQDQIRADAVTQAGKALNGLPEHERFRESVMFQAFLQTVDDPNEEADAADSDEDGDRGEKVPAFQVAWAARKEDMAGTVEDRMRPATIRFLNELAAFEAVARNATSPGGILSRLEVEGADGEVVELVRALERVFNLRFWTPGPTRADLEGWHEHDCRNCDAPSWYDEIDFTIDAFQDIVETSAGSDDGTHRGIREKPIEEVVSGWKTWVRSFYDPDNQGDFYDRLGMIVVGGDGLGGMPSWRDEIETIRRGLALCTYEEVCEELADNPERPRSTAGGPGGGWVVQPSSSTGSPPTPGGGSESSGQSRVTRHCVPVAVQNPSCRGDGTQVPVSGGSTDADFADEFGQVRGHLDGLVGQVRHFRDKIKEFYDEMRAAEDQLGATVSGGRISGSNPATYPWTDSRGRHSVTVEVGPFKVPSIQTRKSGGVFNKKICMRLEDYADDGSNTWVGITRRDQPSGMR
ncbi:MAG: Tad domain-containing protein [Candidatus Omnitrophica bacterium]|nr:Tad domain-containing protein [Candidatus Omnitrophota bacterium]